VRLNLNRKKNGIPSREVVLHLTTVHPISDVRIYQRECRSLAAQTAFDLVLAGPGELPKNPECAMIKLSSPYGNRLLRFLQSQGLAIKIIFKVRPSVLHLHDPELLLIGLFQSRILHRRVLWDAHEDYVAQILEGTKSWIPSGIQKQIANLLQWVLNQVDKNFAGIIGATQSICSLYTNPNTILVGNEARISDFRLANPDLRGNQILFTGAQNNSALFMQVIQAVAQMKNLRLAVAGEKTNPKAWIEAHEILGSRLTYLGYLDPQGLTKAMSNSVLGMVTYKFRESQMTSSPTKFFEFASAGLPVIATPIVANEKLIGEARNGLLTKGFEASDIYEAIDSALKERTELDIWSRNGRLWSETSGSWSSSEQRLLGLYADLISC